MNTTQPVASDGVAVVTGASSGIGRALAIQMAASGVHVYLVARNRSRLEEVACAIRRRGGRATPCETDLADADDVDRLATAIRRDPGEIHVLIHSAGIITTGPIATACVADFDRQYHVNVRAPYLLTQRLLPSMRSGGHIVFINSSAGLKARAGVAQYAATKHALKAVADSLREELRDRRINVLSVFPGRTATPMQRALQLGAGGSYDPSLYLDPDDLATLVVTTISLGSASVKEIDLRPASG
jgi:short-subunit dehydrogenase